jgi:serine protease DegQ
MAWGLLACGPGAGQALARTVPGDLSLSDWLDGVLNPTRASVVQVIAYRPSGLVPRTPDGPGSIFRLEPARRTFWATGIVIGPAGLILACAEAAQPGDSLEIRLPGGTRSGARFLAQDIDLGLSLLRATDITGLAPISRLAAKPLRSGEVVVLVGHRVGEEGQGFRFARVSGSWDRPEEPRFYQLDLHDCGGTCGDAVLDEYGGVRGIIVGVRAEHEEDSAQPSGTPPVDPFECETVRALSSAGIWETAASLLAASRTPVGFLGVITSLVDPAPGGSGEVPESRIPLQVTRVLPGSPADAAGIRSGDQIVSIDGHHISSMEQVAEAIAASPPGREIRVRLLRNGAPLEVATRLADRSALDWLDRQERCDAVRRSRLQAAIERLKNEIRELDAERRRGP